MTHSRWAWWTLIPTLVGPAGSLGAGTHHIPGPMHHTLTPKLVAAGFLAIVTLVGCDAVADSGSPLTAATALAPPSGVSAIDGRSIVHLTDKDLDAGTYAATVRQALVGHGLESLRQARRSAMASDDGSVLLKDVLSSADARSDKETPSTHIVLSEGSNSQEYVLMARLAAGAAGSTSDIRRDVPTYAVLDPEVFHTDVSDGEAREREIPVTDLATGREETALMTARSTTVNGKDDVAFVVIEAVPIASDVASSPAEGGASANGTSPSLSIGGSYPYLGVVRLTLNQNYDSGWTVNEKQEVEVMWDFSDNYAAEIDREAQVHFDQAFWTVSSRSPTQGSTTAQSLLSSYNGPDLTRALWFYPADVNYADVEYDFSDTAYQDCIYLPLDVPPLDCETSAPLASFPLIWLNGSQDRRTVLHEDDWDLHTFSTRDGDWSGNVGTYNFGTGGVQTVYTKVDGNNHDLKSSDRVFTSSGVRRVNVGTVGQRTNYGATTVFANVSGLKWEFAQGGFVVN